MPKVIYLAAPYSDPDRNVRVARVEAITKYAAKLFNSGKFVFSPLTHSHHIAEAGNMGLAWGTWREFDIEMLRKCDSMIVLKLDGWEKSNGVKAEVAEAIALSIPITYCEP